mmetsp:Transcript_1682/g.2532  ORF Transcript_1682/g.2532 Transcript_1682/m.2532 type:complete len:179 (+) Transcript_1682:212-748(+)
MDALISVWGPGRVGIRISPHDGIGPNLVQDSNPELIYTYVIKTLNQKYGKKLAYLHLIETTRPFVTDKSFSQPVKLLKMYAPLFEGTIIAASGFTPDSAAAIVESGLVDAVAFGRFFISTPDLAERIRIGAPPNKYTRKTFYTMGTHSSSDDNLRIGYTDYPTLTEAKPDQLFDLSKI